MAQGFWDKSSITSANTPSEAGWAAVGNLSSNVNLTLVDDVDAEENPVLRLTTSIGGTDSGVRRTDSGLIESDTLEVLARFSYEIAISSNFDTAPKFGFFVNDPC